MFLRSRSRGLPIVTTVYENDGDSQTNLTKKTSHLISREEMINIRRYELQGLKSQICSSVLSVNLKRTIIKDFPFILVRNTKMTVEVYLLENIIIHYLR